MQIYCLLEGSRAPGVAIHGARGPVLHRSRGATVFVIRGPVVGLDPTLTDAQCSSAVGASSPLQCAGAWGQSSGGLSRVPKAGCPEVEHGGRELASLGVRCAGPLCPAPAWCVCL